MVTRRLWPLLALPVMAIILGVIGTSMALWTSQDGKSINAGLQASLGLAVTKGGTTDYSASVSDASQFTLGSTEVTALIDAELDGNGVARLAIPFDVTMLTSALCGMNYEFSFPTPAPGSLFGLGNSLSHTGPPGNEPPGVVFFRVGDPGYPSVCTTEAAATASTHPGGQVGGIPSGKDVVQTLVHQWCMVVAIKPPVYQSTASASGTDTETGKNIGSVAGDYSTWRAYLIPDATGQTMTVSVTPKVDGCTA